MAKLIAMFLLNLLRIGARGLSGSKGQGSKPPTEGEVRIPNRSIQPLFHGNQGNQKPDIRFDLASRLVTIRLLVLDPSGYFIPNIRRENLRFTRTTFAGTTWVSKSSTRLFRC
jgi:hypothetical protein